MAFLIRGASLLTMRPGEQVGPITGDVLVDGRTIVAVAPTLDDVPGATVLDGRGKLLMPGLVNGHAHSGETFFKGRYANEPLELWMLHAYPIILGPAVPPRLLYLRSALFALEALKGGATTVCDDFIDRPFQDLDRLGQVFSAYRDVGIRANVSQSVADLNVFDTMPFAKDLVPAELRARNNRPPVSISAYQDFCREAFSTLHQPDGRLRFMLAPSAPQRSTPELMQSCAALAAEHGVALHTHVLETRMQAVTAQKLYGRTLIEHLRAIDVLGPNLCAAHAIWLTRSDVESMGDAGCAMVHNAVSNLKLGSGISPIRRLLDAGVHVGLGTDGLCSNDTGRIFDVVRAAATLQNVTSGDLDRWISSADVLRAATVGGARTAMLHERVGSLEVGKRADILCLDLGTLAFFPLNDLPNQLVHCENGTSIDWVMVDGEIVVRHGRTTKVDEAALRAEATSLLPEYLARHSLAEADNAVFAPWFARIHERCLQVPLTTTVRLGAAELPLGQSSVEHSLKP
jgi:5-methylthioadenosine/S-adenosylhomocysteine deaminase